MNSWLQIVLIGTTLSTTFVSASGKSRREIGPEPTVCVRFYNQAQVQAGMLKWAKIEATRIFKTAGVIVAWQQSATDSPEAHRIDLSTAAFQTFDDRHCIVVRVLPRTPANLLPGALGFALPFAQGGSHVSIFYDRVESVARAANTAIYVVLGHAMAHEIGHVLLRSSEHSTAGLMQGRWNGATWRFASNGLLAFLPEQADQLRRTVAVQGRGQPK